MKVIIRNRDKFPALLMKVLIIRLSSQRVNSDFEAGSIPVRARTLLGSGHAGSLHEARFVARPNAACVTQRRSR